MILSQKYAVQNSWFTIKGNLKEIQPPNCQIWGDSCCLSCPIVSDCCCFVTQSCLTLCDPVDCSPPGSSVRGILQARILEWIAVSFPQDLPNPGIKLRSPTLQAEFFFFFFFNCLSYLGRMAICYSTSQVNRINYQNLLPDKLGFFHHAIARYSSVK